MERFVPIVYFVLTLMLPLCLLIVGPILLYIAGEGHHWWQTSAAAISACLLVAVISAAFAYTLVPADYTLFGKWTTHPTANPLNEIHAIKLQRANSPGMMSPDLAIATRKQVEDERRTFLMKWIKLTLCGLAALSLSLFWHFKYRGTK